MHIKPVKRSLVYYLTAIILLANISSCKHATNDLHTFVKTNGVAHGFSLDSRMCKQQINALSDGYRIVFYDVRGFDRSALPTNANDLKTQFEYLKIQHAHITGLYIEEHLASEFVIKHPNKVDSLIFSDSVIKQTLNKISSLTRENEYQTVCDTQYST